MNNQADNCKPSDTPLTDAVFDDAKKQAQQQAQLDSSNQSADWFFVAMDLLPLARTLERELNEARARIAEFESAANALIQDDFGSGGWTDACDKAALQLRALMGK